MSKPPRFSPLFFLLWIVVILAVAGIATVFLFSAPGREKPPPFRVKVEQVIPPSPTVPETPADTSSSPLLPHSLREQPPGPQSELPPKGDEQSQQVASVVPPPLPGLAEHAHIASGQAKIALVIDDLGLDIGGTKRAMKLPAFVTLSFMPYATRLKEQTAIGKEGGHELLLHMPMEPLGHADPGPGALLVGLPTDELRRRFDAALDSFTGFDGVNNHMGSKFTADTPGMEIVIEELQSRGLFFLDSRTSAKTVGESIARQHGLPTIGRDVFLDDDEAPAAIHDQMEQAERIARKKGIAVVIGHPHAVTLDALETWIPDAQTRGFTFVPLNELVAH